MNLKVLFTIVVLFVGLTGCSTVEPTVPAGTYRENGTSNFVRVFDNHAQVRIAGVDQRDNDGSGLVFKYILWRDGQLWLVVSRSAELTFGYPALEYFWDGNGILAVDAKSGVRREFKLQRDP